jgi:hypothetical protein
MEGVIMAKTAIFIKYLLLGFVVLTGGLVSTADALNLYVPGAVPPWYPTIQAAINASIDGDIITVIGPATYSGTGFFNVDFNGKDVTVQSGDAAGNYIPWSVTIDCNYLGRAFIFQSGETVLARVQGFIIINGYAQDTSWPQDPAVDASGYGGAIYIKDSSPIIRNCEIYDCTADAGGGAIFCDENGDAQILGCDIGTGPGSYNFAGWGFYQYIDINDVNDVNQLDVNDLHQLGGGIYCMNSSPRIDRCDILWNTAAGSGGGIACENSNADILNCSIEYNDTFVDDDRIDQHGGGIYIKDCKGSGPEITRCFTQVNTARWSGGGIAVIDSNALIELCSIYDNHCWASGGGIYSQGNPHSDPNTDPNRPNCRIQNTYIVFNWGYWSGGASSNYGSSMSFSNATITRNVASWSWLVGGLEAYGGWADGNGVAVWDNIGLEQQSATAGVSASAMVMEFGGLEMESFGVNPSMNFSYSNIQMFDSEGFYDPNAVWPGEGNINKDPLFVNPHRPPYDIHLQSTSPCINAGDPFADYSLEPALNGGRINIGAYGGTEEATSSDILRPVPSDADEDLEVNLVDFAILANNWGLEGTSIQNKNADADNNNIIDARDLSILNKFWLWQQKGDIYDPSDLEANIEAVSKGDTAIPGEVFSQEERKSVRKSRSTKPAGKVSPTPKLQCSPDGVPPISEDQLTEKQEKVLIFSKALAKKIMGVDITAEIYMLSNKARATYGDRELSFNLNRLGKSFFEKFPTNMEKVLDLLIHEFGHEYASNHLSDEYSRALTSLGAKTAMLALKEPEFFKRD